MSNFNDVSGDNYIRYITRSELKKPINYGKDVQ